MTIIHLKGNPAYNTWLNLFKWLGKLSDKMLSNQFKLSNNLTSCLFVCVSALPPCQHCFSHDRTLSYLLGLHQN